MNKVEKLRAGVQRFVDLTSSNREKETVTRLELSGWFVNICQAVTEMQEEIDGLKGYEKGEAPR
jgi:hypothetical protein